jgi:hypothetical protein
MEPSARLAIVVLVVVAASVANAAGTDSLPHMNSVAHATDDTMLTVECDPTSRGKAECSIVEVTVIQPRTDPREREKAIADFDALTTGKKDEAEFAKVCADVRKDQSPASGRRKECSDRLRAACAAKDPPALWRAVRAWQDDVEAKTEVRPLDLPHDPNGSPQLCALCGTRQDHDYDLRPAHRRRARAALPLLEVDETTIEREVTAAQSPASVLRRKYSLPSIGS